MSLFKRKGRRISTLEDAEQDSASPGEEGSEPAIQTTPVRFGRRPNKQSALRRSTNVHTADNGSNVSKEGGGGDGDDDEDDGPAVVRPTISRSGSTRSKKRMSSSSRLSFGVNSDADGEDRSGVSTPRRTGASSLSQRVLETNAFRKSLSGRLPTRPLGREEDDDDDRPRYSKEYLDELQSSTPNTPRKLSADEKKRQGYEEEDSMQLDASELEGAMVVDLSDLGTVAPLARSSAPVAHVLTETEIQERKDRRARLALEQDAMALGSEDDEENGYISLMASSDKKKRKEETRLVREDEDLGEGYDEFVEDGGLSLGRKAEREARRRRKQEMESLIRAAEGTGGDDTDRASGGGLGANDPNHESDDSEAERQAAYNAAQIRAGMDGLHRPGGGDDEDGTAAHGVGGAGAVFVPKMRPLPDFEDCLARMRRLVQGLEDEVAQRRKKLQEVEAEKAEILAREVEVQEILNKAGQKYQTVLGSKPETAAALAAGQSPLRPLALGSTERGLESLGGTPLRRTDAGDAS